ncbi:MAG: hypothetical protein HZY73_14820 [Micropruina sp.]|nr:MAG: hypothetical protein HZY73_14820 [Micropruina sp.]
MTTRVIPGWAVLFAILGFLFFLLGLLFLLVREERTTGFVQVQVVAPGGSTSPRSRCPTGPRSPTCSLGSPTPTA